MIQKIEIENFQSHKHTVVDLTNGVNIVVGSSDSGKTAIIRALRWAVWNRPLGDSFRSHWGGDTSVVLTTDTHVVERFEGKHDHYKLWPLNEDGEKGDVLEFKAFGTEPPEEILDALNLSELNVQNQMDGPFLISNNPGEVSRHFNKIANIDKIDSALKAVESWVRRINQDIRSTKENIERYENTLDEFEYLDKMEMDVEVLEEMNSQHKALANKASQLNNLVDSIEKTEEEIEDKSELLPLEGQVNNLVSLYAEKNDGRKEFKELKNLCLSIVDCQKQIKDHAALLNAEETVESVLDLYSKKAEAGKQYKQLNRILEAGQDIENKVSILQGKLGDLENEWHENMPDICPLCQQEVA